MGDYIERKRVIDLITSRYENPEICAQEINEIPAADVAPVVRGRWIEKPYLLGTTNVCSVCGENYGMPHGKYKFCPNCGADMRGGERPMTDLERRALLGDAEAQRECTENGIALACPFCGNEPITEDNRVFCGACGLAYEELDAGLSLRAWNTRPAPPIGRCGGCAHWYKQHCAHGPCATEPTDADFFCGSFKPKGGEENAVD